MSGRRRAAGSEPRPTVDGGQGAGHRATNLRTGEQDGGGAAGATSALGAGGGTTVGGGTGALLCVRGGLEGRSRAGLRRAARRFEPSPRRRA